MQCSCRLPSGQFCLPFAMNLCRFSVTSLLTTSGHPFLFMGLDNTGRITSWDKVDNVSKGDSAKSPYVTCKTFPIETGQLTSNSQWQCCQVTYVLLDVLCAERRLLVLDKVDCFTLELCRRLHNLDSRDMKSASGGKSAYQNSAALSHTAVSSLPSIYIIKRKTSGSSRKLVTWPLRIATKSEAKIKTPDRQCVRQGCRQNICGERLGHRQLSCTWPRRPVVSEKSLP